MKLYYDKRLHNPTYYVQQGFRNGNKTSTRNVKKLGKHSDLLLITDDPLAYVKNEIRKMNEDFRVGIVNFTVSLNFNEKVLSSHHSASNSNLLNIGYFYLQDIYNKLKLHNFFTSVSLDSKITFDCNQINRFLTYARILDPSSKYGTFDKLASYYEQPDIDYQHMIRFMDILNKNSTKYLTYLF